MSNRRVALIAAALLPELAAALLAQACSAGPGVLGHPPRPAAHRRPAATLYIYASNAGSAANRANVVIPVNTATNMPGEPIHVGVGGAWPGGMIVITPDGKTAYVASQHGCRIFDPCTYTVTPISTETNTPGKPIPVGGFGPYWFGGEIAITPDGKTAYVNTGSDVTPINTATGTPGKPIPVRGGATGGIAITP